MVKNLVHTLIFFVESLNLPNRLARKSPWRGSCLDTPRGYTCSSVFAGVRAGSPAFHFFGIVVGYRAFGGTFANTGEPL